MITIKEFDSVKFCGYKQLTTFYRDFGTIECLGIKAIQEAYEKRFNAWKFEYKHLTELVLVLNWKVAEHYDAHNDALYRVYSDLWRKAEHYAITNLKGKELDYYYDIVDMPD